MTDVELYKFLKTKYGISFPHAYIRFINNFSKIDSGLKTFQVHHICPRSCGGDNDERNLIRVSFHHHRKLHQLILKTEGLTDEQLSKLRFAYQKMRRG